MDDLKNDTDFIDVSDKLSQPSMEISNEPEFDNEDDTDIMNRLKKNIPTMVLK